MTPYDRRISRPEFAAGEFARHVRQARARAHPGDAVHRVDFLDAGEARELQEAVIAAAHRRTRMAAARHPDMAAGLGGVGGCFGALCLGENLDR